MFVKKGTIAAIEVMATKRIQQNDDSRELEIQLGRLSITSLEKRAMDQELTLQ